MGENYNFRIKKLKDNRCKIKAIYLNCGCPPVLEELRIPAEINGYKVVSIGTRAAKSLRNRVKINKLIIPNTIEHICEFAFYFVEIHSVIFEENSSIREISYNAFYSTGMTHLDINSQNPLKLGAICFSNNNLKELDLSKCKIGYLDEYCFSSSQIEKVTLPPNIKKLSKGLFFNNNIRDISFLLELEECEYISEECFCQNKVSKIPDEVFVRFFLGDWSFSDNAFTEIYIPEYAKLGVQVFSCNKKLKKVVSNVEIIPSSTFQSCNGLREVEIKNATEILPNAFRYCAISRLVFEDNKIQVIDDYAFADNKIEVLSLENTSLTTLGRRAFLSNCLSFVYLPFYLSTIYESTFEDNPELLLNLKEDYPFVQVKSV